MIWSNRFLGWHTFLPMILITWLVFLFVKIAHGTDFENYTYQLTQSTSEYQIWTTPPSRRVFKDDDVPAETDSQIRLYAAGNESEPFQVVVKSAVSGTVDVEVDDFGSGITVELFQVKYVNIDQVSDNLGRTGPYPDPLWLLENGADEGQPGGLRIPLYPQ